MQQAGAWPFVWNGGSKVTIDFTGKAQMAFANYWQKLVSAGAIDHANDPFTGSSPFFEGLNGGIYLTWPTSAWGPSYFASYVTSKSAGDWIQARSSRQHDVFRQLGRLDLPGLLSRASTPPKRLSSRSGSLLRRRPGTWRSRRPRRCSPTSSPNWPPRDAELDHPHAEEGDGSFRCAGQVGARRSRRSRGPRS